MKKARSWEGYPPENFIKVIDSHPEGWDLYLVAKNGAWMSLKLVATKRQQNKANYSLGYNTKDRRFAEKRDDELLRSHRPELREWLRAAVEAYAAAGPAEATPAPHPRAATRPRPAAPQHDWPRIIYDRMIALKLGPFPEIKDLLAKVNHDLPAEWRPGTAPRRLQDEFTRRKFALTSSAGFVLNTALEDQAESAPMAVEELF